MAVYCRDCKHRIGTKWRLYPLYGHPLCGHPFNVEEDYINGPRCMPCYRINLHGKCALFEQKLTFKKFILSNKVYVSICFVLPITILILRYIFNV